MKTLVALLALASASAHAASTVGAPGAYDAWQKENFTALILNDTALSASTADPDGDGQSNDFEFTAGLSPLDSQSRFLHTMQWTSSQAQVVFSPRVTDRDHVIETSSTLSGRQALTNFTTSDNGTVRTITDLNAPAPCSFYRVRITGCETESTLVHFSFSEYVTSQAMMKLRTEREDNSP